MGGSLEASEREFLPAVEWVFLGNEPVVDPVTKPSVRVQKTMLKQTLVIKRVSLSAKSFSTSSCLDLLFIHNF